MIYFCPNCHKKIQVPELLAKVRSKNGVKVNCTCGGAVTVETLLIYDEEDETIKKTIMIMGTSMGSNRCL